MSGNGELDAAGRLARAVAERARGRRRLGIATIAASLASILAAGAVAIVLPGASQAATTSNGSSSTSNSSNGGSSATNDSSGFQTPVNSPSLGGRGGAVSTSGGT